MKTLYCKHSILAFIFLLSQLLDISSLIAQPCPLDVETGNNLVTNGDFSQGYTGWSYTSDPARTNGYLKFDPPFTQNYSSPGFIHVGATPSFFNAAFTAMPSSSPSGGNMLMVDGVCALGAKLWQQTNIPVKASTRYYFSVWINALKNSNDPPGQLQFEINNTTVGLTPSATITAPISQGPWIQYEAFWDSPSNGTATISIENITTTGCASFVDFAIDDISFIPGCQFASPGAQPDLGPDQTLCGGNTPITLDAGIPVAQRTSSTVVTWWDGTTNTGTNASFYTKNVTLPGTYSVCVKQGTSCLKSDIIVVSNTYSFDIGGPYDLCSPISQLLDAQHSGTGVSYRWYYKTTAGAWVQADTIAGPASRLKTYTATAPGRYRVVVTDVACGTEEDETTVTSSATATPIDAHFCPPDQANLAVNGVSTGIYNWYTHPTNMTLAPGSSTNTTTYLTPTLSVSTTYYVEDAEVKTTSVGQTALPAGASTNQTGYNDKAILFTARVPFTIDSATVYWWFDNNSGHQNDAINVQFKVTDSPAGYNIAATTITTGPLHSTTIATAMAQGRLTPNWPNSPSGIYAVRVPVGIPVAGAGDYRLAMQQANGNVIIQTSMTSYVYPDVATGGDVAIVSSSKLGQNPITNTDYHDIYNWKISYKTPCARIPVRAIADCILPVEYLNFRASAAANKVLLFWTTAWEQNNDYFIIERSVDGIHFEPIGKVNGQGNSNTLSYYTFTDYHPLNGTVYYRLLQYDINGAFNNSNIIAVNVSSQSQITVNPNPNSGSFNISFKSRADAEVKILLYNALGQIVREEIIVSHSDVFSHDINIQELSSAVYFLHIEGPDQKLVAKVVKE